MIKAETAVSASLGASEGEAVLNAARDAVRMEAEAAAVAIETKAERKAREAADRKAARQEAKGATQDKAAIELQQKLEAVQKAKAAKAKAAAEKAKAEADKKKGGKGAEDKKSPKGGAVLGAKGGEADDKGDLEDSGQGDVGSGIRMKKTVYAKLLVQKARKKLANEVRACSVENEAFGKTQTEKYLGETHKKAEAIAAGKAEMKSAIEGLRAEARDAKLSELAKARLLVEHAKAIQSPRTLESHRSVIEANQKKAKQVRELEELCHSLADAAEASTAASKRLLVGKIKIEIGAPALDASRAVITAERFEIRDAVRQMMREGESKIEQHKSAVRTERRSKHELVDEFKKGAKGARTALSSRRKEDADGLRSKSGDLSELRSQSIIETVRGPLMTTDDH
ncbi:hypothetical protein Ctob_008325 [Chrysochromulina tobinii]|uniref:Uncharacterized protein n=1 Tax=Chrysochromulina tobinii TaxID=1460289 RepID=A0A0M0JMT6_9EUKA|nr:hypothetical protein Ctob_008325 [Chrysochromulina tobinii]|eukprot:KOO27810.1 hypothetical protein Ctob_008325 [Chrysochromulina sp. CCMP291]